MVTLWIDERAAFRNGVFPTSACPGNGKDVGHYTQVIWRSTAMVGCALAGCAGGEDEVLVCRYMEGGNSRAKRPSDRMQSRAAASPKCNIRAYDGDDGNHGRFRRRRRASSPKCCARKARRGAADDWRRSPPEASRRGARRQGDHRVRRSGAQAAADVARVPRAAGQALGRGHAGAAVRRSGAVVRPDAGAGTSRCRCSIPRARRGCSRKGWGGARRHLGQHDGRQRTALGPVLGGLLVEAVDWAIFLVNIPIGIAAIVLTARHASRQPYAARARRFSTRSARRS